MPNQQQQQKPLLSEAEKNELRSHGPLEEDWDPKAEGEAESRAFDRHQRKPILRRPVSPR